MGLLFLVLLLLLLLLGLGSGGLGLGLLDDGSWLLNDLNGGGNSLLLGRLHSLSDDSHGFDNLSGDALSGST